MLKKRQGQVVMGLLHRKEYTLNSAAPLYTIGGQKTYLFIGLGNPGKEYADTRHNIGFAALDRFAQKNEFPAWILKKDLKCHITAHTLGSDKVILCKPTTFMNLSGEAAHAAQHYYRIYNPQTVAVYDELSLPFGTIRARNGGEAAGHNGVKSLIQHIADDFGRIRIGIANDVSEKAKSEDFVLGKFTKAEQEYLPLILQEANAMMVEYLASGQLPHDTRAVI